MPQTTGTPEPHLTRGFGLLHATALNMSNVVGVGPFITIPLILATMGGPQAMAGWVLGAILATCAPGYFEYLQFYTTVDGRQGGGSSQQDYFRAVIAWK